MQIKLVLFGENVGIPKTPLTMGLGLVSLWVDGRGFTSATNDLGGLGYVLLETKDVDIGSVDAERQQVFTKLHGRLVRFQIQTNKFIRDGGIARICLTAQRTQDGGVAESSLEFMAENCTGISLTAGPIEFTAELLQMAQAVAMDAQLVSDDQVFAVAYATEAAGDAANA